MKNIYFVRHGESVANATRTSHNRDVALTDLGREQAEFVGKRLAKVSLDVMLSSTMPRACETAHIINRTLQKPMETFDVFEEVRKPSVLIGTSEDDPLTQPLRREVQQAFVRGKRHSDEELFTEVQARVRRAFACLSARTETNILVVTHGNFLRFLVGTMIFGDAFTPEAAMQAKRSLVIRNTAITWCEGSGDNWHLITWNDHAHLGTL